jgi:hypothetical protein
VTVRVTARFELDAPAPVVNAALVADAVLRTLLTVFGTVTVEP